MLRLAVAGACGRMGSNICRLAVADDDMEICSAFERPGHADIGRDIGEVIGMDATGLAVTGGLEENIEVDVLIDFTEPRATLANAALCAERGINMVVGTTGLGAEEERSLSRLAEKVAVVYSPNMAIGVNVLFDLAERAACLVKNGFDVRVNETHHVHKKDSPSGTAKMLASLIEKNTTVPVPVDAAREGEVTGFHRVTFESDLEKLVISHDAKDRSVFAAGALKAALYVSSRRKGSFDMKDVLGMR